MLELFFTGNATWFSIPALLGTVLFVMRLAMLFLGSHGADLGDHGPGMGGHASGDANHPDSADAFRLLSLEAFTAAMMGVGWGGLAALKGTDWPLWAVVATSISCGVLMVWIQAMLLRGVHRLQASGNLAIKDAMGAEGVVYIAIPGEKGGKGQVTLVLSQRQRQFNAITVGGDLPSQTRVRVVGVNDDNTVTVVRVA